VLVACWPIIQAPFQHLLRVTKLNRLHEQILRRNYIDPASALVAWAGRRRSRKSLVRPIAAKMYETRGNLNISSRCAVPLYGQPTVLSDGAAVARRTAMIGCSAN